MTEHFSHWLGVETFSRDDAVNNSSAFSENTTWTFSLHRYKRVKLAASCTFTLWAGKHVWKRLLSQLLTTVYFNLLVHFLGSPWTKTKIKSSSRTTVRIIHQPYHTPWKSNTFRPGCGHFYRLVLHNKPSSPNQTSYNPLRSHVTHPASWTVSTLRCIFGKSTVVPSEVLLLLERMVSKGS